MGRRMEDLKRRRAHASWHAQPRSFRSVYRYDGHGGPVLDRERRGERRAARVPVRPTHAQPRHLAPVLA